MRLDHIGDLILTIPAISAVREAYPNARLYALVGRWNEPFARFIPYIDELIVFSPFWFDREKKGINIGEFVRLIFRLRRERFDVGVDFRGYLYHILLMSFAGVKFKVGYGATGGGFLLDLMPEYKREIHEMEKSVELVRALGAREVTLDQPRIFLPPLSATKKEFLSEYGIENEFIVFAPFAGRKEKEWLIKKWKTLLALVLAESSYEIVLVGPKGRENDARKIIESSSLRVKELVGKIDATDWARILSFAKLVVSVDSASAHIAAAFDIPVLLIASGINPVERWKPVGPSVCVVVKDDIRCYPCEKKNGCARMDCLFLIEPEEVFEKMKEMLSEKGSNRL